MRLPSECYQMQKTIEPHLPHLSQEAGSACQNAVASALSPWSNWYNLRQRLGVALRRRRPRDSLTDGRNSLRHCCGGSSAGGGRRLGLGQSTPPSKATSHRHRIRVVYRSCAIPWPAHVARRPARPWMDPTVELLQALAPAVPENMTVSVLCDRGIASPKLWQQIRDQGWHPGMRYRKNIDFLR